MKKKFLLLLLSTVLSAQLCGLAKADETDSPASADTSSTSEEDYTEYENVEDTSEAEIADIASDSSSESELINEEISTIEDTTETSDPDPGLYSSIDVTAEEDINEMGVNSLESENDDYTDSMDYDYPPYFDVYNHTYFEYDVVTKHYQLYDEETGEPFYDYTGWYKSSTSDTTDFYLINGKSVNGLKKIDGKTYYFDPVYGILRRKVVIPIINNHNAYDDVGALYPDECLSVDLSKCKLYYIQSDGTWSNKINGWQYAYDENGDCEKVYVINGIAQQGFKTIGGKHYFFDDILVPIDYYEDRGEVCGALLHDIWFWFDDCYLYYSMPNGQLAEGFKTIGGDPYYFWPKTENGHYSRTMATGWFKVNGFSYYAIPYIRGEGYDNIYDYPDSGVLVSGFKTIGGKGYYFWPKTENGHYSKTMAKGWFTVNGFKYYGGSDGVLTTGFKTISGKKYYFWPKTSGGHYSKTMAKGWFTLNGFKYYADKNGVLASGWKTINGKKYYFWPKTSGGHYANTMAKGRVKIDGRWYYFQSNGVKR